MKFYFVKLGRLVVILKARKLGEFPIRYYLLMWDGLAISKIKKVKLQMENGTM